MIKTMLFVGCFVCFSAFSVDASDCFPANTGNSWEFDYCFFDGHSGGGQTDSGTVTWTIIAVTQQGSAKKVTITQTRTLHRRTYFMAGSPRSYDSMYNPPRMLSPETISYTDSGNVLYRSFQRYSRNITEVLLHDPKTAVFSQLCVKDTDINVLGVKQPGKLLTTGTCDLASNDHVYYDYFIQVENFGPVRFTFDSKGATIMVGGHSWETWVLRTSPAGVISNPSINGQSSPLPAARLVSNGSMQLRFYPNAEATLNAQGRALRGWSAGREGLLAYGIYIVPRSTLKATGGSQGAR
jgi:hypothetical protein